MSSDMRDESHDRQSFLGSCLLGALEKARIGVVGLSGGGSHVVQELAHIGFRHYVLYDPQWIEDSNLHRLVGARKSDVRQRKLKTEIATRVILDLVPDAEVHAIQDVWQNKPAPLRCCDLIFGCVDTFATRRGLEILSRRYLVPYIDIGMDVVARHGQPPRMAGQVILSLPGAPCMFCMGYLNDAILTQEASRYGDVGGRPQVVWANGVLASTAVGMAIDLLTGWAGPSELPHFLSFDGNRCTISVDPRWTYLATKPCFHYADGDLGDPRPIPM